MGEVIEREAVQKHKLVFETDGEVSDMIIQALKRDKDLEGISFSFVSPEEMPDFIQKKRELQLWVEF